MYHEIHIVHDAFNKLEEQGFGGIHHVAISANDEEALVQIEKTLDKLNMKHSSIKNRGFFKSIYYRDPNQVLLKLQQ